MGATNTPLLPEIPESQMGFILAVLGWWSAGECVVMLPGSNHASLFYISKHSIYVYLSKIVP